MTHERLAQIIEWDEAGTDPLSPSAEHRRELLHEVATLTAVIDEMLKVAPSLSRTTFDNGVRVSVEMLRKAGHGDAADLLQNGLDLMIARQGA